MNKTPWPPAPQTGIPTPIPAKDETDYKGTLEKYMRFIHDTEGTVAIPVDATKEGFTEQELTVLHELGQKINPA